MEFMNYLKYIATLATAIIGIYAILKDYRNKATNRLSLNGVILIFLIILTSSVYLILDLNSDDLQQKYQNDLTKNIDELKKENADLNNKISRLIEDNFSLSRELTKNVLGDGFAIFGVVGQKKPGNYYCQLTSVSEYPIYDISLLITDFESAIKCKNKRIGDDFIFDDECFYKSSYEFSFNTLAPKMRKFVDHNFISREKYKNMEIKISSRKVNILQQSVFELKPGPCRQSYRIYKIDNGAIKLIIEKNELNLPDTYWLENFFPIQNRKLSILN